MTVKSIFSDYLKKLKPEADAYFKMKQAQLDAEKNLSKKVVNLDSKRGLKAPL